MPESMIVLNPGEDRFHNLRETGSYEWTYFDGLSDDGEHGFTAIWFRGIPMSPYYTAAIDSGRSESLPEQYCAFAFGLYSRGRRIASGLEEGPERLFVGDTGSPDARFGDNTVHSSRHPNGTTAYHIGVNIRRPLISGRIQGEIDLAFPESSVADRGTDYSTGRKGHFWVPASVGGTFSAALDTVGPTGRSRKHRFRGHAYHDRNFGTEPLHHLDVDWSWGRCHVDDRTFVFFDVERRPGTPPGMWPGFRRMLMFREGRLIAHRDEFTPVDGSLRNHWATLPYPERFGSKPELTGSDEQEPFTFAVENSSLLDSGPFYHRMAGRFNVLHQGERMEGLGMTEYMRPARLGVGIFRPFVKFRVRRLGG